MTDIPEADPYERLADQLRERMTSIGIGAELRCAAGRVDATQRAAIDAAWLVLVHNIEPYLAAYVQVWRDITADKLRRERLITATVAMIDRADPDALERLETRLDELDATVPAAQE